jgi:hypothetical protein
MTAFSTEGNLSLELLELGNLSTCQPDMMLELGVEAIRLGSMLIATGKTGPRRLQLKIINM